jgi:adenosylcobyric acid synthase
MVPHIEGLELPEEDAPYRHIAKRRHVAGRPRPDDPPMCRPGVSAAAIFYPTASNTTDLDALDVDPGVVLRWVRSPEEIEGADLVVLPGSKAVLSDLAWLREHGFDSALERHLRYGGKVLGICGGMQMLGEAIEDPHGIEGGGTATGFGWLPIRTTLAREKRVTTVNAPARWPARIDFEGYEIHHGHTPAVGDRFPFHAVSDDERVWGTYVHGVFDRAAYRRAVFGAWFGADGPQTDMAVHHRRELDRLADAMRASLDLRALERRFGVSLRSA